MDDPRRVLAQGRTRAERLMLDEVTVFRAASGRAAQRVDDLTGQTITTQEAIADATTTGTEGRSLAGPAGLGLRCWVRSTSDGRGDEGGSVAETWQTVRVHVPYDAPALREGDTIHVESSESPNLAGVDIVVLAPITRTRQVAARYLGEISTEAE